MGFRTFTRVFVASLCAVSGAWADTYSLSRALQANYIAGNRDISVGSGATVEVVQSANSGSETVTFKILRRSDGGSPRSPDAIYSVSRSEFEAAAQRLAVSADDAANQAVRAAEGVSRETRAFSEPVARCDGGALPQVKWDSNPRRGDCEPPENCTPDILAKNSRNRKQFDRWILEAANEYGIEPGLLKALVQVETGNRPLVENLPEKREYEAGRGHRDYRWGKGLGQFGANNSADYGLDWFAPMPSLETAMSDAYNQPNADGVFPIWSPRGSILASAKHLREKADKEFRVNVEGTTYQVNVATLFQADDVERARYLSGMHNRGDMPMNSFVEYYRQHRTFPRYYGQAWSVARIEGTPRAQILRGEKINRCHVYKIAGLCPPQTGLYQEYQTDFKRSGDEWVLA